jgi:hypothetical protein
MSTDDQATADLQLVSDLRKEAAEYSRQWVLWLGVGGGGGAVALLTFAARLPDPDYALHTLWPSLAAYLLGLMAAGASLLLSSLAISALSSHYAHSSNRDRLNKQIGGMVQMFSAPESMAKDFNRPRDKAIEDSKDFHEQAEEAWRRRTRWTVLRRVCIGLSALGFAFGSAYPLYLVLSGTSLAPPDAPVRVSAE